MKGQTTLPPKKLPSSQQKLKLLCRFGGSFVLPHPAALVSYVGGETRIVSVDRRYLTLSKLRSRLSDLLRLDRPFSLYYQLPESLLPPPSSSFRRDEKTKPQLISIERDEDVRQMVLDHDRLMAARLRLFVCHAVPSSSLFVGHCQRSGQKTMIGETKARRYFAIEAANNSAGLCRRRKGRASNISSSLGQAADPIPNPRHWPTCCPPPLSGTTLGLGDHDCFSAVSPASGFDSGDVCREFTTQRLPMSKTNRERVVPWNQRTPDSCFTPVYFGKESNGRTALSSKFSTTSNTPLSHWKPRHHHAKSGRTDIRCHHPDNSEPVVAQRFYDHSRFCMAKWWQPGLTPRSNISKQGLATPHLIQKVKPLSLLGDFRVLQHPDGGRPSHPGTVDVHEETPVIKDSVNADSSEIHANQSQALSVSNPSASSEGCRLVPKDHRNTYFPGCTQFDLHAQLDHLCDTVKTLNSNNTSTSKPSWPPLTQVCPSKPCSSLTRNGLAESDPCGSVEPPNQGVKFPLDTRPHISDLYRQGTTDISDGIAAVSFEDSAKLSLSNNVPQLFDPLMDLSASTKKDLQCDEKGQNMLLSLSNFQEKATVLETKDHDSKETDEISTNFPAVFSHLLTQELQTIKGSDLEEIRQLGSGTYGTVYYGKWKGSDVAIKRLKPSCFARGELEEDRSVADFWKEAHLLGQLHHPNVVALYGVVTDGPATSLATVTEYMVNGSLKQVLQRKDRIIDRRKRVMIAMDAAFGMEYLHEKNIVHFDLKSHNFLVNMRDPQRPICKIGDLGLSKVKQRTLVSGGVRGTIPWMAPELLNNKSNMVTEKVDVYSFGIVMWELLTCEEPYENMSSEEIIAGIIRGDLRPEIPRWCDPAWRSLMERNWSSVPSSRPSFSEIARELRAMAATMNIT